MKKVTLLLIWTCLLCLGGPFQQANAQTLDCIPYDESDFCIPNPLGFDPILKNLAWQDHLLILRGDGIHLLNTDSLLDLTIQATVLGSFSDIAVSGDLLVGGYNGHVAIYRLPELELVSLLTGVETIPPHVAVDGTLLAATFGREIILWDVSNPTQPTIQSDTLAESYNSSNGIGNLILSGGYLVGCSYYSSNIGGYYTALSVIDVSDPSLPVMTDYVTKFPFASDDDKSLFFEVQPISGGFILEGLTSAGPYRPEYQSNDQHLARITIDADGQVQWHGRATAHMDFSHGFVVDGSVAHWTAGSPEYIVNFDWDLIEPTSEYAQHSFPSGKAVWIPGSSLMSIGAGLYRVAELNGGPHQSSYFYQQNRFQTLDESYGVQLLWGGPFHPGGASTWNLKIVNTTVPNLPIVSQIGDEWATVEEFAIIGRRVVCDWRGNAGNGMRSIEISANGMFGDPVPCDLSSPYTSIHWDEYDIVANTDGSLVVYLPETGAEFQEVARLENYGGACSLTRVGPYLYVHKSSSTLRVDLHDPANPIPSGTQSSNLEGRSRFFPDESLLVAFDGPQIRWFSVSESWELDLMGDWTTPDGNEIQDLQLSGDMLYMAMGSKGLLVYRFDPNSGLSLYGGNMYFGPNLLPSINHLGIIPCPVTSILPLDCHDPLPVMVEFFSGVIGTDGVDLSWNCNSDGGENDYFSVYRVNNGRRRVLVGTVAQRIGNHIVSDLQPLNTGRTLYQLCLNTQEGELGILAEVVLDGGQFALDSPSMSVYPNPANPGAEVSFEVPANGLVRLSVYSLDGKRLADLVDGQMVAGPHQRYWDGRDTSGQSLATGVYLLRLETEQGMANSRVTLIK